MTDSPDQNDADLAIASPGDHAERSGGMRRPLRALQRLMPSQDDADEADDARMWWRIGLGFLAYVIVMVGYAAGYLYSLDGDGARSVTGSQVVMFIAITLAPMILILIGGMLVQRAQSVRNEARAIRVLTQTLAARAPALNGPEGSGAHIVREVERASHAVGGLRTQLLDVEARLAAQSAAVDEAAERAENRARAIAGSLRAEREALQTLVAALSDDRNRAERLLSAFAAAANAATQPAQAHDGAQTGASAQAEQSIEAHIAEVEQALGDVLLTTNDGGESARLLDALADENEQSERLHAAPRHSAPQAAPEPDYSDEMAALRRQILHRSIVNPRDEADEEQTAMERERRARLADLRRQVDNLRRRDAVNAAVGLDDLDDLSDEDLEDVGGLLASLEGGDDDQPAARMDAEPLAPEAKAPQRPAPLPDIFDETDPLEPPSEEDVSIPSPRGLDFGKLVKAANFPENEDDQETLDALYDVLTDPQAAAFLQSAEDALGGLADLGFYMEDYAPQMAPVSRWRSMLSGDMSRAGELAGVSAPLERGRIAARLEEDKAFLRAANAFCGRYEAILRRILDEANDDRLVIDMADSRSGRAYMMIADAAGRFG